MSKCSPLFTFNETCYTYFAFLKLPYIQNYSQKFLDLVVFVTSIFKDAVPLSQFYVIQYT